MTSSPGDPYPAPKPPLWDIPEDLEEDQLLGNSLRGFSLGEEEQGGSGEAVEDPKNAQNLPPREVLGLCNVPGAVVLVLTRAYATLRRRKRDAQRAITPPKKAMLAGSGTGSAEIVVPGV